MLSFSFDYGGGIRSMATLGDLRDSYSYMPWATFRNYCCGFGLDTNDVQRIASFNVSR